MAEFVLALSSQIRLRVPAVDLSFAIQAQDAPLSTITAGLAGRLRFGITP
jgi:hypothetical protein